MLQSLLNFDSRLFLFINFHNNPALDWIFLTITQLGNSWIITPLLVSIVVIITPRKALKKVLIWGIISMSVSGILNSQAKSLVKRVRPIRHFELISENTAKPTVIHVVGPKLKYNSFPSGHTNTAFSGATLLVFLYGGLFWIAYIAAFLVAYSRIYMGVHFPLDTLGGLILGILTVVTILSACRIKRDLVMEKKND